jgi:hypothetical protein
MKNAKWIFVCLFIAICSWPAAAQAQKSGAKAKQHVTGTQIIEFILNFQEQRLVVVAEAMPEEKYEFAPTGPGQFEGVRTFAAQLKHIAADNFLLGAGILGEKPPGDVHGEEGSDSVTTKAQIIAYLKESFDYMHRAARSIDAANAPLPTPAISPWPDGMATRMGIAVEDCVHTWDHYGQLVEYLRMNGIIPPASRK